MRRASAYPVVSALALSWVLSSCAKKGPARPAANSVALASTSALPHFDGVIGQFDASAAFVDFLEKNADREVQMSITIPESEFKGSTDADRTFFILFDDCGTQPEDEPPVPGPCTGTEVTVNNGGGPSPLVHKNGAWQLSGRFQVGEESGPLQGLMSIELERDLHL
jgi:hypothetical protein